MDPFYEFRKRFIKPNGTHIHTHAQAHSQSSNAGAAHNGPLEPYLQHAHIVLTALNDVLVQRGVTAESSPEQITNAYFGALMLSLDKIFSSNLPKNAIAAIEDTLSGTMYLLKILFPKLSARVFNSKFNEISEILLKVIDNHAENSFCMRFALFCVGCLLNKITTNDGEITPEGSVLKKWSQTSLITPVGLLKTLLVYSLDSRAKVRHVSQESLSMVIQSLVGSCNNSLPKVVADTLVSFSEHECKPNGKTSEKNVENKRTEILYLCGMLKLSVFYLPPTDASRIFQSLLSIPYITSHTHTHVQVMGVLQSYASNYNNNPSNSEVDSDSLLHDNDKHEKLRSKFVILVDKILSVLQSTKAHIADVQACEAYLNTVKIYIQCLSTENPAKCLLQFNSYLSILEEYLFSSKRSIVEQASKALREIIKPTLSLCSNQPHFLVHITHRHAQFVSDIIGKIEVLLTFRYKTTWTFALPIVKIFVEFWPKQYFDDVKDILLTVDSLRRNPEISSQFSVLLDEIIGEAITNYHPANVLAVLPLNLPVNSPQDAEKEHDDDDAMHEDSVEKNEDGEDSDDEELENDDDDDYKHLNKKKISGPKGLAKALDESRVWLLPLLRTYTKHSEHSFFFTTLLPQARSLSELHQVALLRNENTKAKAYTVIIDQIWNTLQGFLTIPTDIGSGFRASAEILCDLFNPSTESFETYSEYHNVICRSLSNLIRNFQFVISEHKMREKEQKEGRFTLVDEEFVNDDDEDNEDAVETETTTPATTKYVEHAKEDELNKEKQLLADLCSPELATASLDCIAEFSRKFLPRLFNLVSLDEKRGSILPAIAAFASVSNEKTLNEYFRNALKKLLDAYNLAWVAGKKSATNGNVNEEEKEKALGLCDIVFAMTPCLEYKNLELLFRALQPFLNEPDGNLQKKSYKILAEMCSKNARTSSEKNSEYSQFFIDHREAIVNLLVNTSSKVHTNAIESRLISVRLMLMSLPILLLSANKETAPKIMPIIPQFLGEILLAIKEPSAKAREAAFNAVLDLGRELRNVDMRIQQGEIPSNDVLSWQLNATSSFSSSSNNGATNKYAELAQTSPLFTEYLLMLCSGLATSPHMQSATLSSLSNLVFSLSKSSHLTHPFLLHTLQIIFSVVSPLIASPSREVRKSFLGILKVFFLLLPAEQLLPVLILSLKSFSEWFSEKKSNRFQEKIRTLLDICMRKLGDEKVFELIPESMQAFMKATKKMKSREQKKRVAARMERNANRLNKKAGKDNQSVSEAQAPKSNEFDAVLHESDSDKSMDDIQSTARPKNINKADSNAKLDFTNEFESENKRNKSKRKRDESDEEVDETERKSTRINRNLLPGHQYAGRSSTGASDARKKGQKFDPFAFVPLDARALNKRHKTSARRDFENALNATKSNTQTMKRRKSATASQKQGHKPSHKPTHSHKKNKSK